MAWKVCERCKEEWPPDEEFYFKPTDKICRACKYEIKSLAPSRSKEARRKEYEKTLGLDK